MLSVDASWDGEVSPTILGYRICIDSGEDLLFLRDKTSKGVRALRGYFGNL